LATAAAVIASQAVISGVFSMTKQAIQLGFLPRMNIRHTSDLEIGQIYILTLNWMLFAAVIMAVLGFGTSARLGAAYGVAVTATMMIETFLTFFVIRYAWRYPWWLCVLATGIFFAIDATFFSATILKVAQGGWFPLVIGLLIFILMVTWKDGRAILREYQLKGAVPLKPFLESLMAYPPHRVEGTAIFMTADPEGTPNALVHNLAHNRILHQRVVFLTVVNHDVPRIPVAERLVIEPLDWSCYRVSVHFGFKDDIDIPAALEVAAKHGLTFEPLLTSYFLSRETVVPTHGDGMALWRERLFATMLRNAGGIIGYFQIPVGRVIELGSRIEI
jgi:KUP system potassium uptake protein